MSDLLRVCDNCGLAADGDECYADRDGIHIYATANFQRRCLSCQGRGYHMAIYGQLDTITACEVCGGKGWRAYRNADYEEQRL